MKFATTPNPEGQGVILLAQAEHPTADEGPAQPGAPETAHTEAGHGGAEQHGGFPPMTAEHFPSQLLWLAITFGVFYWIVKQTLVPRIGGILENRRDRIALDLEAAERMKTDADEAHAAYEQELGQARERSHKIAQDARDSARADADAERKRIDAELDRKLNAAQAEIAETKSSAMREVDEIARDVAGSILRDVVRIDVSQDDVAAAVAAERG